MRTHRTLPAFQIPRPVANDRAVASPATGSGERPMSRPRYRTIGLAAVARKLQRFAKALEAGEDFSSALCPFL
jgi:hypothetical protein